MILAEFSFSVQNIVDGNGISIALMGMLIVFCGLALISMFIGALPRILNFINRPPGKTSSSKVHHHQRINIEKEEILVAIGYVIHTELENLASDNQKVTLDIQAGGTSSWALSNKMRNLPSRGPYEKI